MIQDFYTIKTDDDTSVDCTTIREVLARVELFLDEGCPVHEIIITKWGGRL